MRRCDPRDEKIFVNKKKHITVLQKDVMPLKTEKIRKRSKKRADLTWRV